MIKRNKLSKTKNYCRLCNSKELKKVFHLNKTPIGDDYKKIKSKNESFYDLKLNICKKCKFVQLSNVLDSNTVYGDYLYVTNTSVGLPEHFEKFIKYLIKNKFLQKKYKVLEIGCNDGTLLKKMNNYSSFVLGVDPAKKLMKNLKTKFEILSEDYNLKLSKKIANKYGNFQLIIANNVIANIDDLNEIFLSLKNNLSENGIFIMETFSLYGLLKNNLFDNIYHEHISYFSVKNLMKFALKYDLKLISAIPLSVKGGSIRFVFKKTGMKIKIDNLTKSYMIKENRLFKNIEQRFLKMQQINTKNMNLINKFINNIPEKKLSAYGASVGSTTFIYYYKLKDKIDFIFDDEKLRHNLYSPGTNIKVLSPKEIIQKSPKYILILAWRYSENIIKKNKYFLRMGGQFIVPLPKFKVINNEKK